MILPGSLIVRSVTDGVVHTDLLAIQSLVTHLTSSYSGILTDKRNNNLEKSCPKSTLLLEAQLILKTCLKTVECDEAKTSGSTLGITD